MVADHLREPKSPSCFSGQCCRSVRKSRFPNPGEAGNHPAPGSRGPWHAPTQERRRRAPRSRRPRAQTRAWGLRLRFPPFSRARGLPRGSAGPAGQAQHVLLSPHPIASAPLMQRGAERSEGSSRGSAGGSPSLKSMGRTSDGGGGNGEKRRGLPNGSPARPRPQAGPAHA